MSYQYFQQLFDLAVKIHVPHQQIILAVCACVRTTLQYIPQGENRPRLCLETTERWCRGEATMKEVELSRDNAWQYSAAAAARVSYIAATVASAAAHAACVAITADAVGVGATDAYIAAIYVARVHAALKDHDDKDYQQVYQQAEQEICQIILQHIPRLQNLMVMT